MCDVRGEEGSLIVPGSTHVPTFDSLHIGSYNIVRPVLTVKVVIWDNRFIRLRSALPWIFQLFYFQCVFFNVFLSVILLSLIGHETAL